MNINDIEIIFCNGTTHATRFEIVLGRAICRTLRNAEAYSESQLLLVMELDTSSCTLPETLPTKTVLRIRRINNNQRLGDRPAVAEDVAGHLIETKRTYKLKPDEDEEENLLVVL
jgi:hypothetical protein